MQRFLVTGGCGFIGSSLTSYLLKLGHFVTVVDDLSTGKLSNLEQDQDNQNLELINLDITDFEKINKLVRDSRLDGVFHLAAIASVPRSMEAPLHTHLINQSATINLFDALRPEVIDKMVPVVYASSSAIYGEQAILPLTEQLQPRPLSAYGVDKYACELHGKIAANTHGLANTGLRFFNVYGPKQDASSPYSGVISLFVAKLLANQSMTIYGDGEQSRDFIYIDDVVSYLYQAMLHRLNSDIGADVFNICTGKAVSINQLAQTLGELMNKTPILDYAPARAGDILHSTGDVSLAKDKLGLEPQFDLMAGLKALLSK